MPFALRFAAKLDIGPDGTGPTRDSSPYNANSPMAWAISSTARSRCSSATATASCRPRTTNSPPLPRRPRRNTRFIKQTSSSPRCKALGTRHARQPIVDQTAPFKLAKDRTGQTAGRSVYNLTEPAGCWRFCWPFLPGTAVKIYAQLGLTGTPATRRRDLGRVARWSEVGETRALVSRKMCDFSEGNGRSAAVCAEISRSMSVCRDFECFPSDRFVERT